MNKKKTENKGDIIIYKTKGGEARLEVNLQDETVWLTQDQMVNLFKRDQSVISRHISKVFKEGELSKKSNMHFLHIANSDKPVVFYSLDVIISVGYRVKSLEGTKFRIWATRTLKDHLIKGYTLNESRLKQRDVKLQELEKVIRLFQDAKQSKMLNQSEADGLLHVITEYANSWILLNKYDQEKIAIKAKGEKEKSILDYDKAKNNIIALKKDLTHKKRATDIFGAEREHGLEAVLGNINQSFGGKALYPTIEQKAAHLLYFVIKDHPFVDGNKRIGSFLFIAYLSQNKYLLDKKGEKKINDNALVALALLVAQSNPKDRNIMIALITNLL